MGTQNIILCFECEHTLVITYKHIKKTPNFNSTLKITKYLKKLVASIHIFWDYGMKNMDTGCFQYKHSYYAAILMKVCEILKYFGW